MDSAPHGFLDATKYDLIQAARGSRNRALRLRTTSFVAIPNQTGPARRASFGGPNRHRCGPNRPPRHRHPLGLHERHVGQRHHHSSVSKVRTALFLEVIEPTRAFHQLLGQRNRRGQWFGHREEIAVFPVWGPQPKVSQQMSLKNIPMNPSFDGKVPAVTLGREILACLLSHRIPK